MENSGVVTESPPIVPSSSAGEENHGFSEFDREQAKQEFLQELRKRETDENQRRMGRDAAGWLEEGRMLESIYPGFKLENECRDPRFLRLLEVGMSMRGAFEALHHQEILEQAVRYTAQSISEKLVENPAKPPRKAFGKRPFRKKRLGGETGCAAYEPKRPGRNGKTGAARRANFFLNL